MRKWEYVDLIDLLGDHSPDHLTIINGKVIAVTSEGTPIRSCTIFNIITWLQAFSILTAILVSSENSQNTTGKCWSHSSFLLDNSTI